VPIRVTCDECRGAFDAPDEDADGLAPCPKCGAACLVPVPGALPPLLAEAIEPDAPAPAKPLSREALRVVRNEWIEFGRGCVLLKWAGVLGFVGLLAGLALGGFVLALGPKQLAPQSAPISWGLAHALATATALALATSGFLGAVGRTRVYRVPQRCGARAVFAVGAVLAWLRAVCFSLAVVLAFGVLVDDRSPGDLAFTACLCVALGTVFGSIAELSALPALVAVGAAMPSATLRGSALNTTVLLQIGACVSVFAPVALMATAPLQAGRGAVEKYGPLAVPLLGAAVVFESAYAMLLYALYDAGATAGASGGDNVR
jgi:hypothetical protein